MPRILLATLALACVCSPAIAGALSQAHPFTAWPIMPALAGWALCVAAIGLAVIAPRWAALSTAALGLVIAVCGGAYAAEVVTASNTALPLPWGQWLGDLAQASFNVFLIILPPLAAWAAQAIRKRYIWAGLVLTQTRLEQMGQALAEHGVSAIKGAVKGKQLNVELGSRVVAAGLGRGAEAVPRIVWEQAGGAEGVAKLILRKLDLDEEADERSVLAPALASFEASGAPRSASR